MGGPFFRILGENRQQSGAENPYYGPAEMTFVHQMTVPSVAGQQGYLIPVGDWFTNAASECKLEVDMGGGFVTRVFGVDFSGFLRSGAPATVTDLVIGFYWIAGAVPNGWTFRFTWYERVLFKTPMGVAKALLVGSPPVPDMSVKWKQNSSNAPNGVTVPELTGYVVEFWRKTLKSGGLHINALGSVQRRGPRYVPYYRGPASQFNFTVGDFSTSEASKRQHFRVCYYNTVTFARSYLSPDMIVVNSVPKADFVGLPALDTVPPRSADPQVRQSRSVWIE